MEAIDRRVANAIAIEHLPSRGDDRTDRVFAEASLDNGPVCEARSPLDGMRAPILIMETIGQFEGVAQRLPAQQSCESRATTAEPARRAETTQQGRVLHLVGSGEAEQAVGRFRREARPHPLLCHRTTER